VDKKVTSEMVEHFVQAHADGVSMRGIAKLYGVSPTLVHRHITRAAADSTGPEPETAPPEVAPPAGGPEEPQPFPRPPSHARPRPPELEFPETVPGFEPEPEEQAIVGIERELPPERAPGQHPKSLLHPLEWAEHNVKTTRQDIAHARKAGLDDKLTAAEEKLAVLLDFIDTWADAYAGLSFGRPTPYETGVRVTSQQLRDGPPRALWDNPHDHGPRGFYIVGQ
jgi:hypothetical protein